MTDKIVVFSTCSSQEEVNRLTEFLLEKRLAACVTVLPGAQSVYRWEGVVERSQEFLLIIKSTRQKFQELATALASNHSYEVPEVIAIPVVDGSESYLRWIDRELDSAPSDQPSR